MKGRWCVTYKTRTSARSTLAGVGATTAKTSIGRISKPVTAEAYHNTNVCAGSEPTTLKHIGLILKAAGKVREGGHGTS